MVRQITADATISKIFSPSVIEDLIYFELYSPYLISPLT